METLFCLNEEILNYNKVIIYGAGVAGRGLLLKLLQRNVKVDCFADSYPDNCGIRYLNIPIVHIDDLTPDRETSAIIVSGRYAVEVAEELEKRGFKHLFLDYGNEVGVIHLKRDRGNTDGRLYL